MSPAMAASAAYDPSARVPVRYTPSPHIGRRWVRSALSKMTAKGLRLSALCLFILELRRRPVRRPLLSCRCRPLPSVCSIVRSLFASRRQQHHHRHCLCVLLLPPLSRRSSLVAPYTARSCCRQPPFLVLPNDAASPLLCLLICALVGLVNCAI